jgi:hypothetical protein
VFVERDDVVAIQAGIVPPATRRAALLGLGILVFLILLDIVASVTGTTSLLDRSPALFVVLIGVMFLALLYVWIQAFVLLTRDRLLLKRRRTEWIVALALGGPFAGAVFVFWYARRTAP